MTDEQIIKALECCLHSGERCNKCELNGFHDCIAFHPKDILDLINRLKAKNKEFDEKIVMQLGLIDWQGKEINRQKAEIERLLQKTQQANCIQVEVSEKLEKEMTE